MRNRLLGWYTLLMHMLLAALRRDDGATMVEYGILLLLISLAALTAVSMVFPELRDLFDSVAALLFPNAGH